VTRVSEAAAHARVRRPGLGSGQRVGSATSGRSLQTLFGLGSQRAPVRRATIVGASDLPYYYEGDESETKLA
jgi:hypothetical protein